jgi:hypothetical protein
MGRTLSSNRLGEERRDLILIVDPPASCFNPLTDLNQTSVQPVVMLSSVAESFDGNVNRTPPFDVPNPNELVLGRSERERTAPVRNDDPEDYRRR